MGIFAKLRERSAVIGFLVKAQKTAWYPVIYGILCFIGGINGYKVYIPIMWLLISMHLFSVLFADDNKVFLTPLCMVYFAIGIDNAADSFYTSGGDMLARMHEDALKHIIAMGIIGVGSFILRLILDGSIASAFKKRRHFTWGIVAMDIAFLLNGLFSPTYDTANLGFGALLAMGFTVVYFIVSGMLDKSENPIKYACYVTVCLAYSALFQIITVVFRLHAEGKYIIDFGESSLICKESLTLGWGISNVIAGIIILGIPAAMYLAKNYRGSCFFFLSSVAFMFGSILVNARDAMAVGIAAFVTCAVICCISGKNRVAVRLCSVIFILLLCIASIMFITMSALSFEDILSFLRLEANSDSGRYRLWENGIADFKSNIWFGSGFADGGYPEGMEHNNFYSNMYHCILVQLPGAMGIVGCIAFLIHAVEMALLTFKRPSSDKFLMICLPIMIILMSLLDNFFFYLQFQIFYGVFLAAAERVSSDSV